MKAPGHSRNCYIIRSGAAAESRLELLARICWPATKQFLHRRGALRGRVLDIGCGAGDVAVGMIAAGADEAVGIDIDAEVVAFAARHGLDAPAHRAGVWPPAGFEGDVNRPNLVGASG